MLTEKEAVEKWCPIMAYKHNGNGADCIASRCMAWRWYDAEFERIQVYTEEALKERATEGFNDGSAYSMQCKILSSIGISMARPYGDKRRGHCGIAGKPE